MFSVSQSEQRVQPVNNSKISVYRWYDVSENQIRDLQGFLPDSNFPVDIILVSLYVCFISLKSVFYRPCFVDLASLQYCFGHFFLGGVLFLCMFSRCSGVLWGKTFCKSHSCWSFFFSFYLCINRAHLIQSGHRNIGWSK